VQALGPGLGRRVGAIEVGLLDAPFVQCHDPPLGPEVAENRMLDLRMVVRRLLERAGVEEVEVCELCTSCNPDLFFSHRRDHGLTGRQAGLVWASDEHVGGGVQGCPG